MDCVMRPEKNPSEKEAKGIVGERLARKEAVVVAPNGDACITEGGRGSSDGEGGGWASVELA